jgi:hypothetical protein
MTAVCVICSSILSDVNLGGSSPPNAANPVKLARAIPLVHIKNPHVTLQARETVVLALYGYTSSIP